MKTFKIWVFLFNIVYCLGWLPAYLLSFFKKTYEYVNATGKHQYKCSVYSPLCLAVDIAFYRYPRLARQVIVAQAMLESDRLRSNLYKNTNNAFGMTVPSGEYYVGKESAISNGGIYQFSKYCNLFYSVYDFKLYAEKRQPVVGVALMDMKSTDDKFEIQQYSQVLKSVYYYGDSPQANYYANLDMYVKAPMLGKCSITYSSVCIFVGSFLYGFTAWTLRKKKGGKYGNG